MIIFVWVPLQVSEHTNASVLLPHGAPFVFGLVNIILFLDFCLPSCPSTSTFVFFLCEL